MKCYKFNDGIELYFYPMENIRSVTIAFNVGVGSVYESEDVSGISHFIEHLSFRGTKNYHMKELKLKVESVGGLLNAWTDKENTVYYAKVPSFHAYETFKVLKDIVFNPLFKEKDLELERQIIYQEYLSHVEDPVSNVFDLMYENAIDGPHSKPVIGREETIKKIKLEDVESFHREYYNPYNIKVIIVGHVDENDLEKIKEELKISKGFKTTKHSSKVKTGILKGKVLKNSQQIHLLYVKPGFSLESEERFPAMILNTLLSSGMSSFLFDEIREKRGLVYDIYTMNIFQKDWGIFLLYAATSTDKLDTFHSELFDIFSNFNLSDQLYDYGLKRLIGKLELSTESTATLTNMIIDYLTNDVKPLTPMEIVQKIKDVSKKEVQKVYEKLIKGECSLFYVSPTDDKWIPKNWGNS
ncbi:M16 family metallopeptidase [Thermosipho atlanticus]|uniref:Predicted Zn-dependent peptidase n=1 Tax=Thermosipho atlanticus DSM 15807 TaxID=1123380 RepID=A0A1M5R9G3_9BACT|nr:pitrilysin family protein [Thermosipho atlanticus]SHH22740.1 Predicted Zn-dependent peptidase [Thermosipho atlanticus DSM 15807]